MRAAGVHKGQAMNAVQQFEAALSRHERQLINRLDSPAAVQAFLDSISYKIDATCQAPLGVMQTRRANCFDGALFAATALRRIGHTPAIIHMLASDDDDHIIALYRRNSCVGAVAKSNFVGLRFREAIYRNIRELIISYFEAYFNLTGKKSLRAYSNPLNLSSFDRISWMTSNDAVERISLRLDRLKRNKLVTASMVKSLSPVDKRTYQAHMLGATMQGIYKPKRGTQVQT
jgi:hypothetical protein